VIRIKSEWDRRRVQGLEFRDSCDALSAIQTWQVCNNRNISFSFVCLGRDEDRLLQLRILLPPLLRDLLLCEPPGLPLQHLHALLHRHLHLLAHRNQATRQVLVVLAQQCDGQHEVVDVVEDQRVLIRVLLLLRQERDGMVTPVAERIEVMRGVIPVVVAVAIAL